jgi:alpha-tubulin suppressor-like RCC1 family protein
VRVSGLTSVTAVAAGGSHSLALRGDGTVWAWGFNNVGQLGDGTTTPRSTAGQVSGLTGATALAAGNSHSVVLRGDGTAWAWGVNASGQLGDGTTTQRRTTAGQVAGLTAGTSLASGPAYTLVLRSDRTVSGWGDNSYGQLGDGTAGAQAPVKALWP